MNKEIATLLRRLSFEICEGCPKRAECDVKVSTPIKCKKRDLINEIVIVLREKS